MNKAIFMGRLTRDPEVRYGASGGCIANFAIAVDRKFKRDGQPDADFFNCSAFGKTGEFVEKYLKKGTKIVLDGEVQNDNYTNKEGATVYGTKIIVNSVEFAESKAAVANNSAQPATNSGSAPTPAPAPSSDPGDGFMQIPDGLDEELPFS